VKSKSELGFSAVTPMREGLKRTIAWTRANRDFIDRCMAKHAEHMKQAAPA
jgi:UDP-glucose 4-epimerase